MKTKRLSVTAGDPAGIGPEIVAKAIRDGRLPGLGPVTVHAEAASFDRACREAGLDPLPREAAAAGPRLAPIEIGAPPADYAIGRPSAWSGAVAAASIEAAVRSVLARETDAVVTAPISKIALHAAGVPHPGHTEMLAALAGVESVAMMFVAGDLRLTLATIHVALSEVPDLITPARILEKIRLTRETLIARAGIREPTIAVLGLNPHAGEAGMFGREEIARIEPALQRAREKGWAVDGPFPADSFFARRGEGFDAVIAMYHDQGLIPVKLLGQGRSVNVTLGLPFLRTSPDHGTAYDIAGQGTASADSLVAAAELAARWA
jgi:4-hydroxythreonine-4-phosphate dehydrogenase